MMVSAVSTQSDSPGVETDTQLVAETDLKAVELENGLLKNEVQSLNNELTSLMQRARQAESG